MRVLFCIQTIDYADHIAIPYLSAVAKAAGHTTALHINDRGSLNEAVTRLRPDVVAYSSNVLGFDALVEANRQARRHHDFQAIMGGPQATFSPETFAQSGMDAYCVGEGEETFRDYLDALAAGRPPHNIPGLITAAGSTPVRPLIRDLDSLPFPDRDITLANSHLKDTPKKTFYATRGCLFQCNYCCNNYYHDLYRGKGPVYRRFSVDRLLSEIVFVGSRYTMKFVKFGDDLFAFKADDWLREFAQAYPKRVGLPFNCYLRLDCISPELLELLRRAGCYSVHLSVDSLSPHVRENILHRNMKKDADLLANMRMIRSHGINTWVNFMLAAPDSTLEDDLATIAFSKKGRATYTAYSTTVPMEGTRLHAICEEKGLISPGSQAADLSGCSQQSRLNCFGEKEKGIRYNVFLLGAVIARLPWPLDVVATRLLRIIPPNRLFRWIRHAYYKHSIENNIFRLHDKESSRDHA